MDGLPQDWEVEISEIERCLLLTKVDWQDGTSEAAEGWRVGTVRSFDVNAVLATAWNAERLKPQARKINSEGLINPFDHVA